MDRRAVQHCTKRISQMKHSITTWVCLWLWSQKGCFIAHNYHYQPDLFGFLLCSHSDNAPPVQIPTQPLLSSDSHTHKPIDLLCPELIVLTSVDCANPGWVTLMQLQSSRWDVPRTTAAIYCMMTHPVRWILHFGPTFMCNQYGLNRWGCGTQRLGDRLI